MPITSYSNPTQNGLNLGSILIDVQGGVGGGGGITIEVTLAVQNSMFQCIGTNPNAIPFGDNDVIWRIANYTGSASLEYEWQRPVGTETTDYVVTVRAPNDQFQAHWGYVPAYSAPMITMMAPRDLALETKPDLEIDPQLLELLKVKKGTPKPRGPRVSNSKPR
jgi:hypothetical protein